MSKNLVVLTVFLTVALGAGAQQNEVALLGGAKVTPSVGAGTSQTTFATTFAFEANYAHRLAHAPFVSLQLEFPAVFTPASTVTTGVSTAARDYSSIFFTPALRLKLAPSAPISPWISAGGGISHFNPNATNQAGGTSTAQSTTKGAAQAGVGFDYHAPVLPLAFRIEARDFYAGIPNLGTFPALKVRHNIFVGGGLAFYF